MKRIAILVLFLSLVDFGYSKIVTFKLGAYLHPTLQKNFQVFTDPNTWPIDPNTGTVTPQKTMKSKDFSNLYEFETEVIFSVFDKIPLSFGLSFSYTNQRLSEKESPDRVQEDFSIFKIGIPILYQLNLFNGLNINSGIVLGLGINNIDERKYRLIAYKPEPDSETEYLWELIDAYDFKKQKLFIFPRIDVEYSFIKKIHTSLTFQYEYLNFKYKRVDLERQYKFAGLIFGINLGYVF